MNNEAAAKRIRHQLAEFSLRDQVEVLANVLMYIGASSMEDAPSNINQRNIAEIIMNDRKNSGETIANALATQGLTMMLWLTDK